MLEEKLASFAKEEGARRREYENWLRSIRKPSFKLPYTECNSVEERDRLIAEKAKKGIRAMAQSAADWKRYTSELEQRHQERMIENIKAKIAADKEFDREREMLQAALEEKAAEANKQQEARELDHEQKLKELRARVKAKPLMI